MTSFFVIYLPEDSAYGQKEKFVAEDRDSAIEQARSKMDRISARAYELFEERNHVLQRVGEY